ncbi:MAG: DUF4105 domain-containing protein, partial [Nitrospira sp.]|nr:DUF4105 domain-containing protein [Nitrospira sp.]
IARATAMQLAEEHEWHVLLHYRHTLFGGFESMQDDPGFFLDSQGKVDPKAELGATLEKFFSDELVGRSKQPAQCAFIARYHWLKERLQFNDLRLPPLPCERFTNWFKEFNAETISLIFPTGFMNNPSSMFGHTFLRVDAKGQTPQTRILAYTINYAAQLPPDAGPEYAIKGVFGAYQGYFSTIPYYLKVQEYRDIENRDIWEYRLNLNEQQVNRLLMHAWELGNAYFDYFFFGENCAYHILSLIEAAEPSAHLLDRFPIYTIPVDTVRWIGESTGLVGEIVARPSRSTLVRRKRDAMSENEQAWLKRLIQDPETLQDPSFHTLQPQRRAFVMDTASDYLLLRTEGEGAEGIRYREKNRKVLSARSELKVPPLDLQIKPYVKQPDLGHGTSRIGAGAGWRNNRAFEEVNVRAAYHDLLDSEPGYTPDAQIEVLSFALRHYQNHSQARIERFSPLNMISLAPLDSLFMAPSWKLNIGMNTIAHRGCQLCSNGNFNGGIGGAVESHMLGRELFFAFAEADANVSRAYEERHRIGGGGTIGVLADLSDRWKLMASGSYLRYALGEQSEDIRWSVGQRLSLTQNLALRTEYHHRSHDNDVLFTLHLYY